MQGLSDQLGLLAQPVWEGPAPRQLPLQEQLLAPKSTRSPCSWWKCRGGHQRRVPSDRSPCSEMFSGGGGRCAEMAQGWVAGTGPQTAALSPAPLVTWASELCLCPELFSPHMQWAVCLSPHPLAQGWRRAGDTGCGVLGHVEGMAPHGCLWESRGGQPVGLGPPRRGRGRGEDSEVREGQ